MADNSRLNATELANIYLTYEQYGAAHLGAFIQAIWKEAYEIGKEDGMKATIGPPIVLESYSRNN